MALVEEIPEELTERIIIDAHVRHIRTKSHYIKNTRKNATGEWKILYDMYHSGEKTLDETALLFAEQLIRDKEDSTHGKLISNASVVCPRPAYHASKECSKDKTLGNRVAEILFEKAGTKDKDGKKDEDGESVGEEISLKIFGCKFITEICNYYHETDKKIWELRRTKSDERVKNMRGMCCVTKFASSSSSSAFGSDVVSEAVAHPTAMPVTVAPYEELAPFMEHLSSNKEIEPNFAEEVDGESIMNCMKFTRGALYTDGRLDLCKQVVGPDWSGILMESLAKNDKVKHFLLGNNIIGTRGAEAISNFIRNPEKKCNIETWYLAGNNINSDGIEMICNALIETRDTQCKNLWLKRNPLMSEGIKHIANLLKNNNTIQTLDLDNTAVFDEGMKYLAEGLKENNSLRTLYIDSNNITPVGVRYLADYFRTRRTVGITGLYISINKLGDEGTVELLESLRDYPYMERLCLGSNMISSRSASTIYEVAMRQPNLVCFDLGFYKSTGDMGCSSNILDDDSSDILGRLLVEHPKLLVFNVSMNHFTDSGIEKMCRAALCSRTLIKFYFSQFQGKYHGELYTRLSEHLLTNRLMTGVTEEQEIRAIRHTGDVRVIDSIYRNKM